MPELERARVLAFEVKLSAGSIAKLLLHEYGRRRTADGVRSALTRHYGWHGTPHGRPFGQG